MYASGNPLQLEAVDWPQILIARQGSKKRRRLGSTLVKTPRHERALVVVRRGGLYGTVYSESFGDGHQGLLGKLVCYNPGKGSAPFSRSTGFRRKDGAR